MSPSQLPSSPSETPVLALHGFAGGPESFADLHLPSAPWLCPALAGHGPEPDTSATDFVAEVDRIAAWVRARVSGPVRLLGYSMGARVALGLCARHPMLLTDAILVSVHPGLRELQQRRERQLWEGRWVHLLETEGLAAFLQHWQALPLFASQRGVDAARLERQRRVRQSHGAEGLARAFRVLGTGVMPDLWPALRQIQLPVCLVVGELDAKFVEVGRRAVDLLPNGRLEVIANAGHNVLIECPETVRQLLSAPPPSLGEPCLGEKASGLAPGATAPSMRARTEG